MTSKKLPPPIGKWPMGWSRSQVAPYGINRRTFRTDTAQTVTSFAGSSWNTAIYVAVCYEC